MSPGINRNISEADYHAFSAVSKSKLWAFAKNPHKWALTKNIPMTPTASMTWGSLVDCLILQPHELSACFTVSSFADFRTNEAQPWRDSQTTPVSTLAQVAEARKSADAVRAHLFARMMLAGSETQITALADGIDPETGAKFICKCRLDIVPDREGAFGEWLVDHDRPT